MRKKEKKMSVPQSSLENFLFTMISISVSLLEILLQGKGNFSCVSIRLKNGVMKMYSSFLKPKLFECILIIKENFIQTQH